MISESEAIDYLRRRAVVECTDSTRAVALGGGVSNDVVRVSGITPTGDVVVKRSLSRLRVADEWLASRERTLTEGDALRLAASLTPGSVPDVLDVDDDTMTLTIAAAPRAWRDWKSVLLTPVGPDDGGAVDAAEVTVARTLAHILATWHATTCDGRLRGTRLDDAGPFEQLRIAPYFGTVIDRRAEDADAVRRVVDEIAGRRICLVHGDFSPKNVLVGGTGLWVIDFEVAHLGDPRFDVAFLLCHLMLKSIHQPWRAHAHHGTARAFLEGYLADAPSAIGIVDARLSALLGALMLARVHGKSPVEYLSVVEQGQASEIGSSLVHDPTGDPSDAWERLQA